MVILREINSLGIRNGSFFIQRRSFFVIAFRSNSIEPNQTQSNLINVRLRSIAPIFLREFDCVRLPNPIEPNHMIEFDWVRLDSIKTVDLIRLVTSGNTVARSIPFQRMVTQQVGSKLFPLSTITFTLDVPVIINI